MWTQDVWTCNEDSYYGLPYVTDAGPSIPYDGSSIQTPWILNPSEYYDGLPYIKDADIPIAIDHTQIQSMWTIMPPFNYSLPFIRLAEDFKYAYGIYVYNTEAETVRVGDRLVSHVYTGNTQIIPY